MRVQISEIVDLAGTHFSKFLFYLFDNVENLIFMGTVLLILLNLVPINKSILKACQNTYLSSPKPSMETIKYA